MNIFWGEMQKFFDKRLKKVVQKFRQNFGPPVSEVLDPLVSYSGTRIFLYLLSSLDMSRPTHERGAKKRSRLIVRPAPFPSHSVQW